MALATGQITINNIKETISVVFSKSNQVFAGGVSSALAGTVDIYVNAYIGTQEVPYTFGSITPAAPTGLTITPNSIDKKITLESTTALIQPTGTFNVEVIVNGVTINKALSYAISTKGDSGPAGSDGKGISSTLIEYKASSSGTVAPTGTWTTAVPAVAENQYLWTKITLTYTDGSTKVAYSVGKMGAKGDTGSEGKGISSTEITYKAHTSGTIPPTGTWETSPPVVAENQYLWTKILITYTDTTTSTAYSVGKMGAKGDTGATGSTGPKGDTGESAKSVDINASSVIFKSTDGGATFSPDSIILTPIFQGGVTYLNWQYSTNGGSTWITVTTQNGLSINSTSKALTIAKTSTLFTTLITNIVFRVNTDNATIYDTVNITKIYDVVDLSQEAIFNKLTNNGATQGLFLDAGKLYLNGEYLRVSNLVAGNALIQNGYLNTAVIKDASITSAKIESLAANKIVANSITTSQLSSQVGQNLDISSNTAITNLVSDVSALDGRLDSAELKITPTAIINTVTNSTQFSEVKQTADNVSLQFNTWLADGELHTGITEIDADGVRVGVVGSPVSTRLASNGTTIFDQGIEVSHFGEYGSHVPDLVVDTISGNVINILSGSMSFTIGIDKPYKTISEVITYLGNKKDLGGELIALNLYGNISDAPVISGFKNGQIDIYFNTGAILSGKLILTDNQARIRIRGTSSSYMGRLRLDANLNAIAVTNCQYVQIEYIQIDGGTSTQGVGAYVDNGSVVVIRNCDINSIGKGIICRDGAKTFSVTNRGNCAVSSFEVFDAELYVYGRTPIGTLFNQGVYSAYGAVTPTASAFTSPTPTATTFKKVFKPKYIYTLLHGTSTKATQLGSKGAQGKWGANPAMDATLVFASEVYHYFNGGTSISVKLRVKRYSMTNGPGTSVAPVPYNFTATGFSPVARGSWSPWATISSSLFTSPQDTLLKFYSDVVDAGYAVWEDAEVEVTVTKTI